MSPHLVSSQLVLLVLLWLCVLLPSLWPSPSGGATKTPTQPLTPTRKRSPAPKAFAGLTHKPHCVWCAQETGETAPAPPRRPDPIPPPHRRPRAVDTSRHCCPHRHGDDRGWPGMNTLRAHGPPNGGPWRQLHCPSCAGYFPAHHGTICHGKQAAVARIVRVLACLAEGLGMRATARVVEVAPHTVLAWWGEAAEHLRAVSASFLCDVHVEQWQLDAWYAVLRALKGGERSDDAAIARLERSPSWGWTAMAPQSKLRVVVDVGTRTLAMAQRGVPQRGEVLAPGGVPLCLTDGCNAYTTARLPHFGQWLHPARRSDQGALPKPRWMPRPAFLYAQGVTSSRRRRIVGVTHCVVCGTPLAIEQVFAACGWPINTAVVERLTRALRQCVAAIGRRVNTLCQGEAGVLDRLVLFQTYHNFVLPHASLRQPLPVPATTHGQGSATVWRPCTPAMAAGLSEHGWTLQEVLMFRVPPWPPPQPVESRAPVDARDVAWLTCAQRQANRVERGVENAFRERITG
jgi:hypothetical protein